MRVLLMVVAVTVLSTDECGTTIPKAAVEQRQEIVNRCIELGGIPVLDGYGQKLERCEFPPVAPIIKLPEAIK